MLKKEIHASWLTTLFRCGEQFRRRYILGEKKPPAVALITGSATHKSIEKNLQEKIISGNLLPEDVVTEIAYEEVDKRWENGVELDKDERELGERKMKNIAEKQAIACSLAHYKELAPKIQPIAVEDTFEFTIKGTDWKIKGTSDIEERIGKDGIILRDTKTANKKHPANSADVDRQLTMYSLKIYKQTGKMPDKITKDVLVKPSIKKLLDIKNIKELPPVEVQVLETHRNVADLEPLLNHIAIAIKQIEAGIFPPTNPENWWCSPRFCGYYDTCPYVLHRKK